MKLKFLQVQKQRQSQKIKLIYAGSATIILGLIAVFSFVFNIGNVRSVFAIPTAAIAAAQSGNWNATSTWVGGVVPTSASNVTIANGYTVTVNIATAACTSIILGGASSNGGIAFSTSSSPPSMGSGGSNTSVVYPVLTVSGSITRSVASGATGTITMQSGATLSASSYTTTLTTTFSSGTVIYTGTASIIATTYYNLTINAPANTATFAGSTTVTNTLTITSGTLSTGSYSLDMKGNFVNNGIFTSGTNTTTFDNTAAQNISGTSPSFYNLIINNAAGITLSTPVTVSNTLTLTSGKLTLGTNKLTVSGSISGGGTSNFIETNSSGVLEMVANHTTGTVFPVGDGYNPITIQPVTADATFDVSVANGVTDKLGTSVTNHAVGATWTVKLMTGSTQNVTAKPQWNAGDELSLFTRTNSYVSSRTSQVGGNAGAVWVPSGSAGAATGSGPYIRVSGNISMATANTYYIGVGDNVSALPVTLTSFNAIYENNQVDLKWVTASEINNSHFDIERSTDGQTWQKIGREEGHGNSTVTQNYTTTDDLAGVIPAGDIYYRLKQVDFNGASEYSMIRSITVSSTPSLAVKVYPNPTVRELNINWESEDNGNTTLKLVNLNGATLYSENVTGMGSMHKQLDMSNYKSGTYFVQIVTDKNTSSQTVVKR